MQAATKLPTLDQNGPACRRRMVGTGVVTELAVGLSALMANAREFFCQCEEAAIDRWVQWVPLSLTAATRVRIAHGTPQRFQSASGVSWHRSRAASPKISPIIHPQD
jgi:hypothetical protein